MIITDVDGKGHEFDEKYCRYKYIDWKCLFPDVEWLLFAIIFFFPAALLWVLKGLVQYKHEIRITARTGEEVLIWVDGEEYKQIKRYFTEE